MQTGFATRKAKAAFGAAVLLMAGFGSIAVASASVGLGPLHHRDCGDKSPISDPASDSASDPASGPISGPASGSVSTVVAFKADGATHYWRGGDKRCG